MAKSIIQTEKECYVCKTTTTLHLHHCLYGTANRKLADMYKLTVWLCPRHHNMSDESVHFNKELDLHLKRLAQEHYEARYGTREDFRETFGRSYLK